MRRMTIREAADVVSVSPKAIRLWEAKGLIRALERTAAGYRVFGEADLAELRFIRQARQLGLSLEEIKDILDVQRAGTAPCDRVVGMLDARLGDIERQIAELRQLRQALRSARRRARDRSERLDTMRSDPAMCPIITSSLNK